MNPQHDSIVFSVTFNEAPDVTTQRRVYMLNVAEDISPYTISVEQAFNVTDHNALTYTYKGNVFIHVHREFFLIYVDRTKEEV